MTRALAGTIVVVVVTFLIAGHVLGGTAHHRPTDAGTRAAVVYRGRVGMDVSHDLLSDRFSVDQIKEQLTTLRRGGILWVREDLPWATAEPERGVFNWAPFDRFMEAAALAKMRVLGILDYSAPWASSEPTAAASAFYPPQNDRDFAAYARAVAVRYGSDGSFWRARASTAPTPLAAVEIWNEPYGSWFWRPTPNPQAYDSLVRVTARQLHAADRHLKVLMSGELQSWDEDSSDHLEPWLARLLSIDPGVAKLVDGIDIHPYPTPRSLGPYAGGDLQKSYGRVALIRHTELAFGVRLPIWITEIGWSTAPNSPLGVSDQTQTTYTRQAIQRAIVDWGNYVSKIFVYGWIRAQGPTGSFTHNFGLLNSDGIPKPAWGAMRRLLRH